MTLSHISCIIHSHLLDVGSVFEMCDVKRWSICPVVDGVLDHEGGVKTACNEGGFTVLLQVRIQLGRGSAMDVAREVIKNEGIGGLYKV